MNENKSKEQTFGERLKQLRIQKGFSQSELGNLVNMHYTQIGRYERGLSKPSAAALTLLADILNVSGDYLYEGQTEDAAVADFEDKELLQMFKKAEKLDPESKLLVKKFLAAFLKNKEMENLMAAS
jgi:transcriptional regulator with XRE-family HTH domain